MKRRDLIKKIEKTGCVFLRHGGKHDWYHPELVSGLKLKSLNLFLDIERLTIFLAKHILKMLANKP